MVDPTCTDGLHMTKVSSGNDDTILKLERLTIRAIRRDNGTLPAKEWFDALDLKIQAKILSAAKTLENSWTTNRPAGERWMKVKGYDNLWEFAATARKANPSLRIYGTREQMTLWAAHGVAKKSQPGDRQDYKRAQEVLEEFRKNQKESTE